MKVCIIDYGAGNIKSIQFALQRMGAQGILSNRPEELKNAERIIFPGVGEAGSAMFKLRNSGLSTTISELKQPVLGICLGMQLLCNSTEESNTEGLGIFDVNIKKFSSRLKVPQIGWNTIHNLKSPLFEGITENEHMYFVHSYYAPVCDQAIALTDYGPNYTSALQKDNFYGVQFHPEKSGAAGEQILANFLKL